MKMISAGAGVLLIATCAVASAKDITVNEKEQLSISQICEIAARSPSISLEVTASIAGWCVQWAKHVNEQQQAQPQPQSPSVVEKPK